MAAPMIRYALMLTILVALISGPANGHNPPTAKAKGSTALERKHHRLHQLKGHAWAMVKHPRSYRELVWHRKALHRINRRLQAVHRELAAPKLYIPGWAVNGLLCIHRHEGAWNDSGDPYWGGLQMDRQFMSTYAPKWLLKRGYANVWSPWEQMWVAYQAVKTRGFGPWPNTRRMCGV